MGQCGELVFYTERELDQPVFVLRRALKLCAAENVGPVTRTLVPDNSWEVFQRDINRQFRAIEIAGDDVPTEHFSGAKSVEEALALYRSGVMTTLHVGRNSLGQRMVKGCQRDISERIAELFVPSSPIISIGYHDLYEASEHEDGLLFGRPFFSFKLYGNSSPHDWKTYRKMVFQVPEIRELKRQLEEIAGPLEQCIYWSV